MLTKKNEIIEGGVYGRALIVNSPWSNELIELVKSEKIRCLTLNMESFSSGDTLNFISELPDLLSLSLNNWKIKDLSPLNSLQSLRRLDLNTMSKSRISFSNFPNLERLSTKWCPGCEEIFSLYKLEKLFLQGLPVKFSLKLSQLTRLRQLSLSFSKASDLSAIGDLKELNSLSLVYFSKLSEFNYLARLNSLVDFQIASIDGFYSLEPLYSSKDSLRFLSLENVGHLESVESLKSFCNLERVSLLGKTIVDDGRLKFLKSLPKLKFANFANRKHYDATWQEMPHFSARCWGDGL